MNKVNPHDIDAEKSVIGAALIDNDSVDVSNTWIIDENDFYNSDNKKIWTVILELRKKKEGFDSVIINATCREIYGENTPLASIITDCEEFTPSSANAQYYARIVRKKSIQRQIIAGSRRIHDAGYEDFEKSEEMLNKQAKLIRELQDLSPSKRKEFGIIVGEALESIETGNNIVPYGIPFLDGPAGGTSRGGITVLGGRPGHGKTTLATYMATKFIKSGYTVLMLNRQISNVEIIKKIITMESENLSYTKVRKGRFIQRTKGKNLINLNDAEMLTIKGLAEEISEKYKNLYMFDNIRTLPDTMKEIQRIKPDVVIDDYIQLIKFNDSRDRRFQLEEVMLEYEWESKPSNNNFATILLSQLNRDIEKRFDPRPKMADFSEGGTIEQIAETALFVFYGYVFDHTAFRINQMEIISAKTRYGVISNYPVGYNGDRCRFYTTEQDAISDRIKNE